MRKNKYHSGQMRIIEVVLASFIIVIALLFANIFAMAPTSERYQATELEKLGYNVLLDMDKHGLLPTFVYKNEWGNLTAALRVSLPLDSYFNLTVYYSNGTRVNAEPIFYGIEQAFEASKDVSSITYGLVGYASKVNDTSYTAVYDARVLVLQLTRV